MAADRMGATATVLADGRALIAGGFEPHGPTTSAETYDLASNAWASAGQMQAMRGGGTATLLKDGRVLVAGGFDQDALASAELYDPGSSRWIDTGAMSIPRVRYVATLLDDGRVLVAGGMTSGFDVVKSAELYDPASGRWTATAPMNVARAEPTATLLADGRVLVVGGSTASTPTYTASAEIYDPSTQRWALTTSLPVLWAGSTLTRLKNGTVLLIGGFEEVLGPGFAYSARGLSTAELFDPATARWTSIGGLHTGRFGHTATLLGDGRVLVAGGASSSSPNLPSTTLRSAEIYDPATGSWSAGPDLTHPRVGHVAVGLGGVAVLVVGGGTAGAVTVGAEVCR